MEKNILTNDRFDVCDFFFVSMVTINNSEKKLLTKHFKTRKNNINDNFKQ